MIKLLWISKTMVSPKPGNYIIVPYFIGNSTTDISLENLQDFLRWFWMATSKVIANDKNMFSVSIKVTIIASIDVISICF